VYDTFAATSEVESNIQRLKWAWDLALVDRDNTTSLIDFASNRALRHRTRFMDESDLMFAKRPKFAANILGLATDLAASLYEHPVSRYQRDAAGMQAWQELLWSRQSIAMAEADRHALLGGTALLVVNEEVLRSSPEDRGMLTGFRLYTIPGNRWVGLHDEADPGKLAAAWILWSQFSEQTAGRLQTEQEWLYVDANIRRHYRGSTILRETPNRGTLPLVACPNRLSTMTFQGESIGGEDLPKTLASLNMAFEQTLFVGVLSRGQLVVYGDSKKVTQSGPLAPIELDQDDRAETLRQNADIPGMLSAFQTGINLLSRSWNLPANYFQVLTIQPASSAAVLQVSTAELEQYLRRRQKTVKHWEQDLHQTCAAIASTYGISLNPAIDISFPSAPIVLTPAEQLAQIVAELQHGLLNRRGAALELNPHKPIAQVLQGVALAERERVADQAAQALIAGRDNGRPTTDDVSGSAGDDDGDTTASDDDAG
jgi:hypothetical protein